MPTPYEPFDTAGTECSSTYEGRHITLRADMFEHPAAGLAYGSPVVFGAIPNGYGVGVSFGLESAAADWIAVDTEGIWALTVLGTDDEGGSRVEIGDVIYINRTTAVLSKISSDTTNIVFGYALDTVAESGSAVICVKVHWDPHRTDEYRDILAGGAAENAMLIDVDDASTLITGYIQNLQLTLNATGDKGGDAEIHNVGADIAISGDTVYSYNYTAYVSTSGNPTIGFMSGLSIYLDDPGTACDAICAIDVGLAGGTNSPADRHCFMRMRNHSAGAVPDAHFQIEGGPSADYFIRFVTGNSLPIVGAAVGGTQLRKIQIVIDGVDGYIPVHTT